MFASPVLMVFKRLSPSEKDNGLNLKLYNILIPYAD